MAISPLSSVLSPAQIAIVQQARALVAQPRTPPPTAASEPASPRSQTSAQPVRGRGAIINITV
jgi:hypothetical protein